MASTRVAWRVTLQVLVAAATLGAACHKSNANSGSVVTDYVSGVDSAAGSPASLDPGSAPAPSGGPSSSVSGDGTAVSGGSSGMGMQGGTPFGAADVSVGSPSGPDAVAETTGITAASAVPREVTGFWKVTFPTAATQQFMLIKFAQNIPFTSFELRFQAVTSAGLVGPVVTLPISARTTTTATVSVTATWDANSDVNLHVVEPNANEIFSAAPTSITGGRLDRDSMANCNPDGIRTENISWPGSPAPVGAYTVRLDQFNSCSTNITNYVVIVNNGGVSSIVTGSFQPPGDAGGFGSGRLIKQFTHQAAGSPPSAFGFLSRSLAVLGSPVGRSSSR